MEADFASRHLSPETEYELCNKAFKRVTCMFGTPQIDLFASRLNKKCKNYCSWLKDPDCVSVDAFTLSWQNFFFYAFPPFSIVLKVLEKVRQDNARGILVVPFWPTQPWYPMFLHMCKKRIILKPETNLLLSFDRQPHPCGEIFPWRQDFYKTGF